MADDIPDGFFVAREDMDALTRIMTVLYGERPLDGDRRRDLANAMFAVLDRIKHTPIMEPKP